MTETLTTNFVPSLRKAAVCVYIATESSVADDIAEHLNKAADEIDRLTERLAGAYASVNLLTEMLEAKAPQEATESRPVFDYERFSKDFKEAVPFVAPRMEPQTPTHQQLFSGINHFAREILRLTDTVPADCAPHEPQGWQPIETAPRDTPILLSIFASGDPERERLVVVGGSSDGVTWIDHYDYEIHPPTHWMPLPSAPSTKGEDRG